MSGIRLGCPQVTIYRPKQTVTLTYASLIVKRVCLAMRRVSISCTTGASDFDRLGRRNSRPLSQKPLKEERLVERALLCPAVNRLVSGKEAL